MLNILILTTGLMAGIYFVFSVFVMKALALLPDVQGAHAMNRINDVIVRTLFMPLFLGTTAGFVWVLLTRFDAQSFLQDTTIWASVIYIFGMFVVTAAGNVPLNNQLKNAEADASSLEQVWQIYRVRWTRLNHIRTVSSVLATALLLWS